MSHRRTSHRIKINKAGWIYTALTIVIGFSAVNTGNNLIYIIASALLSYMLVSGVFGRKNLHGVDVELQFPEEVFAHTDTPVAVSLINRRRLMPAFLIQVEVAGRHVLIPYVRARSRAKDYVTLTFDRRGLHRLEQISVSSAFPFNFFTRFRRIPKHFQTIVFARPQKCQWIQYYDRQTRAQGSQPSVTVGFDSDIVSIRDYMPGDPLKYVSWKSTAKTGSIKTKELSSIELKHILIDLENLDNNNLEQMISCATYLIAKLVRVKIPVGLKIANKIFTPSTSNKDKLLMLTELAIYGQN